MIPNDSRTIIGIDLGLHKSVACLFNHDTGELAFRTLPTNPDELADLVAEFPDALVVIEACAASGWVHDLIAAHGVAGKVANTAGDAWKYTKVKRKTDRDDALRLVELERLGQLPTVRVPPKAERDWKALLAHRQALVGRRVAVQNRLRATLASQGIKAPAGARAWTEEGLAQFAREARPLEDCGPEELWRGVLGLELTEYRQVLELVAACEKKLDRIAAADARVQLLRTIPGVGPRTAEVVAAHLGEASRFASGKQVGAYFGLVPKQYQSGSSDRRGRITRRGPAIARKLLVECAWCALRYNGWAREVYARLSHGGKSRRKQAVVAPARKLAVVCWAMLRDGEAWSGKEL